MNLEFIKPQNLVSLLMKISQSNSNLQSPSSQLSNYYCKSKLQSNFIDFCVKIANLNQFTGFFMSKMQIQIFFTVHRFSYNLLKITSTCHLFSYQQCNCHPGVQEAMLRIASRTPGWQFLIVVSMFVKLLLFKMMKLS